MISKTTGAILFVALAALWPDARAVESDRDNADSAAGTITGEDSADRQNIFEAPGPPPDGTGVVSVDRVARGSRDGEQGTYYVTVVFDYMERVLVDVDSRVRFVPDTPSDSRSNNDDA